MTLWQRMTFENRPSDLIRTYELHSDLRNYSLVSWRNTRRFVSGPAMQEMTDIVQKDVGARRFPPTPDGAASPWTPINIAYVDERKEISRRARRLAPRSRRIARAMCALPDDDRRLYA
jgi:hypothetical protein